MLISDLNINDQ